MQVCGMERGCVHGGTTKGPWDNVLYGAVLELLEAPNVLGTSCRGLLRRLMTDARVEFSVSTHEIPAKLVLVLYTRTGPLPRASQLLKHSQEAHSCYCSSKEHTRIWLRAARVNYNGSLKQATSFKERALKSWHASCFVYMVPVWYTSQAGEIKAPHPSQMKTIPQAWRSRRVSAPELPRNPMQMKSHRSWNICVTVQTSRNSSPGLNLGSDGFDQGP